MKKLLTFTDTEAHYQLNNKLKIYRKRNKLFVFKAPINKLKQGMEINPELSNNAEKGHNNLNNRERELRNMLNKERSVRRTKTTISDLIEMNDFELMGTFTFSPDKVNRYDDEEVRKKLTKLLSNLQRKHRFEYLIIPERHKDGALHFHGLLKDIPETWLIRAASKYDKSGRPLYNLIPYKLGFSNFSHIEDLSKVANYCAKYITKDLAESDKGKRRYWHSSGLKMPQALENVDITPFTQHPEAKTWDNEHYTGYETPIKLNPSSP